MAEADLALVRELYDRFAAGDPDRVRELLSDDTKTLAAALAD
ncbi:MAG: hypothetical protein ACRDPA_25750 [Solirubrobacteraceae bacterium]